MKRLSLTRGEQRLVIGVVLVLLAVAVSRHIHDQAPAVAPPPLRSGATPMPSPLLPSKISKGAR